MRGESYFLDDHFLEARMEFLRVDINYPDAPRWRAAALLEAGKVDERLGQWSEAVATYDDLIARFGEDPSAAEARKRRAAALDQHKADGPGAGEAK
jgi:TolA-binding protein